MGEQITGGRDLLRCSVPDLFTYYNIKMAQLHVQKKRNQLWWLWLLLILIAIAVVYYLLVRNNVVPDSLGIKNYTTSFTDVRNNIYVI